MLDVQLIPPLLGSQEFLAFLALATAFLHSAFHHGCAGSARIFFDGLEMEMLLAFVADIRALCRILNFDSGLSIE